MESHLTPNFVFHLSSAVAVAVLIGFYFFGVWSRSYIFPSDNDLPVRKQFIASVPVGFLTMGLYAKSAFPALTLAQQSMVFDACIMFGYAIIFGMLSRESLERLMKTVQPPTSAGPDVTPPPQTSIRGRRRSTAG